MKKFFILFVIILSSCAIEYDGETKIVVKGKVVDYNNNPIINKEINLFVSRNEIYFPLMFFAPSEAITGMPTCSETALVNSIS